MCNLGEIDHTYVGLAGTAARQNPCHRGTSMLRQSWMQQAASRWIRGRAYGPSMTKRSILISRMA